MRLGKSFDMGKRTWIAFVVLILAVAFALIAAWCVRYYGVDNPNCIDDGCIRLTDTDPIYQHVPYGGIQRVSNWRNTTVVVHSSAPGPSYLDQKERVHAKIARFIYRARPGESPVFSDDPPLKAGPLPGLCYFKEQLVFVTRSGKTWAGGSHPFYIETESGVIAGYVSYGNDLGWSEGQLTNKLHEKVSLEDAVKRFESIHTKRSLPKSSEEKESDRPERTTKLNDYLSEYKFFRTATIETRKWEGEVEFNGIQVSGYTLRLELKRTDGSASATAWIDIPSRKLLKIEEWITDDRFWRFATSYETWCYLGILAIVALLLARAVRRHKQRSATQ